MQVQLLVERDQNECVVKLAGTPYTFKRNEHGDLVSDITNQEHIKWVSDPSHHTAFKTYISGEKLKERGKDGIMATEEKAPDIFTPTMGERLDIGIDVPGRIEGHPRAAEPYRKVTVTLFESQILKLDKVALVIRERTGQPVSRAELIRAVLDAAAGSLNSESPDFDKSIRELFPILNE